MLMAANVMPQTTVAQRGIDMNLSNLCPIPLAWAPYFMDFKVPFDALQMGKMLIATLNDVAQQTWASPLLDWLWATCVVRLGPHAANR
jgi:hypothetical protein